ncbi:MAG TPA: TonB-dependent receptor, partial [Vicinamibacterales bacterium]|nr:TonB-dependent receptor [Vicinamibacterales bacterium]
LQQGTIIGSLVGPAGTTINEAQITLFDQLGNAVTTVMASNGQFRLTNVAIGRYSLKAEAAPFEAVVQSLTVADALPITLELKLSAALAEQVNVTAESSQPVTTTTRTTLGGDSVRRAPIRISSRGLQDAIATTPGWATEDNGLMHARGVDDGFLYVVDGVPMYERMDSAHGIAPDPEMVESVNVLVGHVPPEFGFKSGGVIEVRTSSRKSDSWLGNVQATTGSDATRQGSSVFGGPMGKSTALTIGVSGQRSERFLDPVHPDNLHNTGNAANATAEFNWLVSPSSTLSIVGGASRSSFDVPHNEEQEEAGQDQRQTNIQTWQTASWQRAWSGNTVSQVAGYHRSGSAALLGSERDAPLFIDADRTLRRTGLLASVTHHRGKHVIKTGVEAARLRLREDFSFFVTDEDAGEEADLSDAVLEHDDDDPFVFAGRASPSLVAFYIQDSVQFGRGLTVDVGVRADRARMLAARSQWSPRLGAAYKVPNGGTIVRGSVDRFFQPPQAENLLLGSSEAARELSPFVDETGGGEDLEPERQWATEIGINQMLPHGVRVDVAYWRRRVDSVSDPNVLFGTTIIVPNAIARGEADGVDLRIDLPRRRGASGYVSYTNSRVVNFGPVTGGLFLEDEVIEIADGTRFIPDHDQRHVAAFGASYDHPRNGLWVSFGGRYESGTPLEVDEDERDELMARPGSELVNFAIGRVRPRQLFDVMAGARLRRTGGYELTLRASVLNLAGERYAYNFGNPFSGTHFGAGRTFQVGLQVRLGAVNSFSTAPGAVSAPPPSEE